MLERTRFGRVEYRSLDAGYVEKRGLKRYAGVWSLWALGVGAVISGDFGGWNEGLIAGGFGGLLIAAVVVTVMFIGLCFSVAEMSAALPHTGAGYSFARSAMGPWGGLVTGISASAEYILLPAILVIAIGHYMASMASDLFGVSIAEPIWWGLFYVVFVGLNVRSVDLSLGISLVLVSAALLVLAVFFLGAIPHLSWEMAMTVEPQERASRFLPNGALGIVWALPSAIWLYLAIEQIPLAAEETLEPQKNMPRAILLGLLTLIITGFLVLFINTSIAPGAAAFGVSFTPIALGFDTILGGNVNATFLEALILLGLVTSFHAITFAYGRNIYSLSRAGYFPRWISTTHHTRKTPHVALITGAAIGYAAALVIYLVGPAAAVAKMLLYMAVYGAVISYIMQCVSFILLRRNRPDIPRPFRSPLGLPGAWIALAISLVVLVLLTAHSEFRFGAAGIAIWYALGLGYFALHGRKALVRSPEEEFALREGENGGAEPAA
jgi:ethanolamine permease